MSALIDGLTALTRGATDVSQYIDPALSWRFAGSVKIHGHQEVMRAGPPYNSSSKLARRYIPWLLATAAVGTLMPLTRRRRCLPVQDRVAHATQGCIGLAGQHKRLLSKRQVAVLAAVAFAQDTSDVNCTGPPRCQDR